jgi:surface antigen
MLRVLLICAPLALVPVPAAAPALAFAASAAGEPSDDCESAPARKKKKLGGMFGNVAGQVLSRSGVATSIGGVSLPTSEILSEAISALLDCKERRQAANATDEAVRGGVGTTSSWQSESRGNVSGSSTVTAQSRAADGSHCMTVTDVVIVDGEETTVPKTMCRKPGEARYARV